MDWKNLFLNANGRIGQKDFWIGFLILFVGGFILGLIPILGMIVSIVLIYPWVCLFSKRLHDFGKTGWLAAVPFAIGVVAMVLMMVMGGAAMFGAASGTNAGAGSAMAAFGMIGILGLVCFAAYVAFVLWVGLSKSDPGTNQYGPPPVSGAPATI
jgi:uncharacterized membrane protein YhaH (DUF805 family)